MGTAEPGLRRAFSYPLDRYGVRSGSRSRPQCSPALVAMRATLAAPDRRPARPSPGRRCATLHYLVATRSVIERCHAHGAAVWAWTVDDPRTVRRLAAAGVDGIVSNDPRVLAATLTA